MSLRIKQSSLLFLSLKMPLGPSYPPRAVAAQTTIIIAVQVLCGTTDFELLDPHTSSINLLSPLLFISVSQEITCDWRTTVFCLSKTWSESRTSAKTGGRVLKLTCDRKHCEQNQMRSRNNLHTNNFTRLCWNIISVCASLHPPHHHHRTAPPTGLLFCVSLS